MPAVALLSWPLIAVGIFVALGTGRGLVWTLLIGFLFLPEDYGFDLPSLPAYNKHSAISLSLFLGVLVTRGRVENTLELVDPLFRKLITLLIVALFAGMVFTVLDNTDSLVRGGRIQPGLGIRELVNFTSDTLILMLPFFLARRWLADPEVHVEVLRAIVILALIYSIAVLFERRISPQLNRWLYGLENDAWRQHLRGGGFRPMVFLSHGLVVGYFYLCSVLAAVGLARGSTGQVRIYYGLAAFWLFIVLFLSRNTGALLLAILFVPALAVLSRRGLLWVVTGVALLFMSYPAAQQARLIPNQKLVSIVERFSDSRAESIAFRFNNEEGLLQRALEKPVFGWGGWGRGRVIDDQGRDRAVTDGIWIIRLGQFGWVGYIAYFGLLTVPLLWLWRRPNIPPATMTLAVITAANIVYLIPNATLDAMPWMIAGTTVGFLQYSRSGKPQSVEIAPVEEEPRRSAYSRFPAGQSRRTTAYRREQGSN